jgi:hypothetical protein
MNKNKTRIKLKTKLKKKNLEGGQRMTSHEAHVPSPPHFRHGEIFFNKLSLFILIFPFA